MDLSSLTSSFNLPIVNKLRAVHNSTKPGTRERLQAALPVIAELEKLVEPVINGVGLSALLAVGRVIRKDLPSSEKVRQQFAGCKQKLRTDKDFVRYASDTLPAIAAKYNSGTMMDILYDAQFLELLKRGAS